MIIDRMNTENIKNRQVVIITDCSDIAFIEMHQTLLNELHHLQIAPVHIAPMVKIKNFSIANAAFSIRLLAELYPVGTVFSIVVNGIASNPARIFGETKNGLIFIGNNSGYLYWLIEDFGLKSLYENAINRDINGKSFGGKYVQIPTTAKILANIEWSKIGIKQDESFLNKMKIQDGTVVHCDNFGLIKLKAPRLEGFKEGEILKVSINGKYALDAIYTEKMKMQEDGKWVLFTGSSLYGLPELGRVRSQNSAAELNVEEGDVITWNKKG